MRTVAGGLIAGVLVLAGIRATGQTAPEPAKVTRITLSMRNSPATDVLPALGEQAGLFFRIDGANRPITLEVKDQPLWEVLADVLKQEGTHSWIMNDAHAVGYANYWGRLSIDGPYLVMAKRIVHEVDYRADGEPVERCQLELHVAIDKAMPLAYYRAEAALTKAEDDAGNSLIPAAGGVKPGEDATVRSAPTFRAFAYPFVQSIMVPLRPPAAAGRQGRMLKVVEGAFPAELVMKVQTLEFDITGTRGQMAGNVPVDAVITGTDPMNITLTQRRPDGMDDARWNVWKNQLAATRCRVVDAEGKLWACQVPSQGGNTQEVSMRLSFSKRNISNPSLAPAGPAAKVQVDVIMETRSTVIPFRFVNVPLP